MEPSEPSLIEADRVSNGHHSAESITAQQPVVRRRGAVVAVLPLPIAIATISLAFWSSDTISPAIADLSQSLALSGTGAGLVISAYAVGRLISDLPASVLGGRFGAIVTTLVGGMLLLAGSLAAGAANGELLLLPARVVQGSGLSLCMAACLFSVVRTRSHGTSPMMIYNLAADIGGGMGLITGGVATGLAGWRAVFVLSAVLGGLIVAGALFSRATRRQTADVTPAPVVSPEPTEVANLSRRVLAGVLLANALVYANYSVFSIGLPLLTAERYHASAERIGTLLLVVTIAHFLAGVPSGRAIRRWGGGRTLPVAYVLSAIGIAVVLVMPGMIWLVIPMVIYAAGQVMGNSSAGDLVLNIGRGSSRAVGMVRVSGDIGMVAGPAAVGALADAAGISASFIMLAVLALIASLATWRGLAEITGLR